jgi:hypothetical protein
MKLMKVHYKNKKHWLRWLLIGIGVLALLAVFIIGYAIYRIAHDLSTIKVDNTVNIDETPTCGISATQIALGSPYLSQPVAYFTTDGSDVYISARHFEHGGIFDPETGTTGIWIGDSATPPIYDEHTSQVSNTKLELSVQEGKHKKAQLPAGRYWLWSSNGGDIVAASCGHISGEQPNGKAAL